jgi:hypothetical protein
MKTNVNFPKVDLSEQLDYVAEKIVIPYMVEGLDFQVDIDGKPLPPLESATWKQKKGKKKLIETGKLHRSFLKRRKARHSVVINLRKERDEVGYILQEKGVGRKKKRFKFFGIKKRAEIEAINYMRNEIERLLENAR